MGKAVVYIFPLPTHEEIIVYLVYKILLYLDVIQKDITSFEKLK